ncbi:MAG: hypothetical protein GY703_19920, partial [Gammaproteobacteria bacterium]|nr:hypothetical protein [Gammaproteobacteria bacterium]
MSDIDCIATLGDPWPHLGNVRNEWAFLGFEKPWVDHMEALCRAELEQAHGRLRPVHRTKPGGALHIGNVLPGGTGWSSGEVKMRKLKGGRPKETCVISSDELRGI